MKKKLTYSSDLICTECGSIFTISRFDDKKRERYHIKDMECYKCKKRTKFIELGDASKVKKELEFSYDLTDFEQILYNLLCNKNEEKSHER